MTDIPTFEEWWDEQWKHRNFELDDLNTCKIFARRAWTAAFEYATMELKRLNKIAE